MIFNLTEAGKSATRTPIPLQEVKALVMEVIEEVDIECHFPYKFNEIVDCRIDLINLTSDHILGQCITAFADDGKPACLLLLNPHLFYNELRPLLVNNICHELCHYYQFVELVMDNRVCTRDEKGRITIDNDAYNSLKIYYRGEEDDGHSACWYKYTKKVDTALKLAIPITAHPEEIDFKKFMSVNRNDKVTFFKCDKCKKTIRFFRDKTNEEILDDLPAGFIVATIIAKEKGVPNNACKCGGSILYVGPKSRQKDLELKDGFRTLKRMFGL